jgi:hypothetical protein
VFLPVKFEQFILFELGVDIACLFLVFNFLVDENAVIENDVLVLPRPLLFPFGDLLYGGKDAWFPSCDFHHLISFFLLDYNLATFLSLVFFLVLGSGDTSFVFQLLTSLYLLWFLG